jgi:hypothetical protein
VFLDLPTSVRELIRGGIVTDEDSREVGVVSYTRALDMLKMNDRKELLKIITTVSRMDQ